MAQHKVKINEYEVVYDDGMLSITEDSKDGEYIELDADTTFELIEFLTKIKKREGG